MKEFFKNLFCELHLFSKEIYLTVSLAISYVLAYYTDIELALTAFAICTVLDSLTRIGANAKKKGLIFNPFSKLFWKEVNSQGLRKTMEKVFLQYGVYLIIAFVIDVLVFKQLVIIKTI